jgi:CRP/FNR family transcriptional regulator
MLPARTIAIQPAVARGFAMPPTPQRTALKANVSKVATHCAACNLREVCLPCGSQDLGRFDGLVYTRRRVKRGETLYRAGDAFDSLYAVRSGFLKSSAVLKDGRDQVTGFHMSGEIVGLDGIGGGKHSADVTALEDSDVCVIPYHRLEELGLQPELHKVMSRALVHDQGVMMLLGTMRAEERLAAFLLNLSQRFVARGYSPSEFHLRMTREEIGSYVGLSLETVSRLFSRFHADGLISVQQRHICILDVEGLRAVIDQQERS